MFRVFHVPPLRGRELRRDYILIQQGLENHDEVELVSDLESADFVFCLSAYHESFYRFPPERLVVLDYQDSPVETLCVECLAYFKRSWVTKKRKVIARPEHFYPFAYAVMDQFVVEEDLERDVDVCCTLRRKTIYRRSVLKLVKELDVPGTKHIGPVNQGGRKQFNQEYLRLLRRSKIVVTCNPDRWEGDSRTWEALANGALVIVDRLHTPYRHPLVDREHCVFFDRGDHDGLRETIMYYVEHEDEARRIGEAGREFALTHHRTQDRIDEILWRSKERSKS